MDAEVIIIGAGMSGLVAAQTIQAAGKSVLVLDKGRSVGGRLATRRIGNGIADHGAQFFTVRSEAFQQQVDAWLEKELVYVWGHGWSDGSLHRTPADGHPRYVTRGGMNQLAQNLAESVEHIRVNVQATRIEETADGFLITDTEGSTFRAGVVLVTSPVPQSLALVQPISLAADDRLALENIEYGPCLCGLFAVEGGINLPEPGAWQNFQATIYWVADNTAKGISPEERIITMHAAADWSREHYDADPDETLAFFRTRLQEILLKGANIKEEQLKKWRYSIPTQMHPDDFLAAQGRALFFAGDAFGGRARVEGAYLSGLAAGKAIAQL